MSPYYACERIAGLRDSGPDAVHAVSLDGGGAERQAERLAHALLRRGCHVEVLTPRLDPSWPERETDAGLTIHRFPLTDLSRAFPARVGSASPTC